MNIKSLAIAAAIIATAGTAQAADLGTKAKVAVDYVKVCDAYGAGFFYIPGSDTCLKIGGYVRTTWAAGSSNNYGFGRLGPFNSNQRSDNTFGTTTRGYLSFDARTHTDFGLLRSFIGLNFDASGTGALGGNGASLDRGFIQWGGLTAGYATSFFDDYQGETIQAVYGEPFSDNAKNLLAYTFSVGNGVTATLSLEDSASGGFRRPIIADAGVPLFFTGNGYGGDRTPDVVAQVMVTQGWGRAALFAGVHQVYSGDTVLVGGLGTAGLHGSKEGFGLAAEAVFNLPMLGAGDELGIKVSYTEGALKWAAADLYGDANVGGDAFYTTGGLKLTKAYAVGLGFDHNFSPMIDWATDLGVVGVNGFGANDFTQYTVSSNLNFKPVAGLKFTGFVEYKDVAFTGATKANYGYTKDANTVVGGIRVRRDF